MTDDIMTRVREWLASCVRVATENGVPEEADLEAAALAFIDGEPARLAAKAEEVREARAAELAESLRLANENAVRLAKAHAETAEELDALRAEHPDIAGVSIWVMGQEASGFWPLITRKLR